MLPRFLGVVLPAGAVARTVSTALRRRRYCLGPSAPAGLGIWDALARVQWPQVAVRAVLGGRKDSSHPWWLPYPQRQAAEYVSLAARS